MLAVSKKSRNFAALLKKSTSKRSFGEMAEWSIAAVLKTVVLRGTGGSNPSLSARGVNRMISPLFFVSNTINTKRKEPHHADAAPFRYTTKKNLFDSCPVKCCANTKDCATQF